MSTGSITGGRAGVVEPAWSSVSGLGQTLVRRRPRFDVVHAHRARLRRRRRSPRPFRQPATAVAVAACRTGRADESPDHNGLDHRPVDRPVLDRRSRRGLRLAAHVRTRARFPNLSRDGARRGGTGWGRGGDGEGTAWGRGWGRGGDGEGKTTAPPVRHTATAGAGTACRSGGAVERGCVSWGCRPAGRGGACGCDGVGRCCRRGAGRRRRRGCRLRAWRPGHPGSWSG
jgi:hypothetical protein